MKTSAGHQKGGDVNFRGSAAGCLIMLFFLGCLLGAIIFVLLNPFNWFIKKADGFDLEVFRQIEPGMQVSEVIDLLGEPIRISEVGVYSDSDIGKQAYYYMGDPPDWLASFVEAWVVIGPDGKVLHTIINHEP